MSLISASNILANRSAKTVEGTYFPNSMALIVCLLTLAIFARAACVIFFLALSTLILFFITQRFIQFHHLPVKSYDKDVANLTNEIKGLKREIKKLEELLKDPLADFK